MAIKYKKLNGAKDLTTQKQENGLKAKAKIRKRNKNEY